MRLNKKIFLDNKYTKWYYELIKTRKKIIRCDIDILQKHHIIPKSLGGSDKFSNLIKLTPREHYICHLLLLEMTFGVNRSKMYYAFLRFKNKKYTTNRPYEFFYKKYISLTKGIGNPLLVGNTLKKPSLK